MTLDQYFKKKKDLSDQNGDFSLAIHPTIVASMNHEVEATSTSTSTRTSNSGQCAGSVSATGKRQPYKRYASIKVSTI